jgi:hypothetical protein
MYRTRAGLEGRSSSLALNVGLNGNTMLITGLVNSGRVWWRLWYSKPSLCATLLLDRAKDQDTNSCRVEDFHRSNLSSKVLRERDENGMSRCKRPVFPLERWRAYNTFLRMLRMKFRPVLCEGFVMQATESRVTYYIKADHGHMGSQTRKRRFQLIPDALRGRKIANKF